MTKKTKATTHKEIEETKLAAIRSKLAIGQAQLKRGHFIDGKDFIEGLIFNSKF